MKKLIASLLVLASFASFGGVVSFAERQWDETNYWKHEVNSILNPTREECANFDDCLKMKAEQTMRYTYSAYVKSKNKFNYDISPFLGSNSKCVKEFNEVNSKWLKLRDENNFLIDGILNNDLCVEKGALNELAKEIYRLEDKRLLAFEPCTDEINHKKSMDLFRALWKISAHNDEKCII